MTTPEPDEATAQHGDHQIVLEVDQPRGVILCSTCSFDLAQLPPEWLGEHNTDVEETAPPPPVEEVEEIEEVEDRPRPS